MQGIYAIVNILNGRCYIGSSVNILKRMSEHLWYLERKIHWNSLFQNAYNKYGKVCFDLCVVEEVVDRDLLQSREQFYLDTVSDKYNLSPFADRPPDNTGTKHTAEHKAKISESVSKIERTPEWCAKIGESNRRRGTLPPESLKKLSDSMKDAWTRIPHPRLGKTFTEESRQKNRESQLARPPDSEEIRRRKSKGQKRRHARDRIEKQQVKELFGDL